MPIATTTALLLGAGIAGATSLGAAKMASGAAKDAAQTQSDSADKALALQAQIYQQQRADTLPFLNRANAAGDTLSALMGLGGGGGQLAPAQTNLLGGPARGGQMFTPETMPPRGSSAGSMLNPNGPGFVPVPPETSHAPGGNWSGDSTQSTYGSVAHGGFGGTVTLRAPDGSVKDVPWDQAQHFIQLGAVRV